VGGFIVNLTGNIILRPEDAAIVKEIIMVSPDLHQMVLTKGKFGIRKDWK
jgi:hypothetical protein